MLRWPKHYVIERSFELAMKNTVEHEALRINCLYVK